MTGIVFAAGACAGSLLTLLAGTLGYSAGLRRTVTDLRRRYTS